MQLDLQGSDMHGTPSVLWATVRARARCYGDGRVRNRGPPGPEAAGDPVGAAPGWRSAAVGLMPVWLSDVEYRTLVAACGRLIPGVVTAGAVEAGVPDYTSLKTNLVP